MYTTRRSARHQKMSRLDFNITDFPTEILEKIFWHFDDTTSTTANGVCKRFNEVMNATVRRKYNGSSRNNWYELEIFNENESEIVLQRPFILQRVSAIQLNFHAELINRNHWMHQLMNRIGRNIQMIRLETQLFDARLAVNFDDILSKTLNISHLYVDCVYPTNRMWCHQLYRNLTHLEMRLRTLFDDTELKSFVKNCKQLTNVKLQISDFRLVYAFDQTDIEVLHCSFSKLGVTCPPASIRPVRMAKLKSLDLQLPWKSTNECVERIVAPCQNLQDLRLADYEDFDVSDATIDTLCKFRLMKTFDPCFLMPVKASVRLMDQMPVLTSITLWYRAFTLDDLRILLEAANKHPTLCHITFRLELADMYNHSMLKWVMENVNNRITIEYPMNYTMVVTRGKLRYDGVTIMTTDGSPTESGKVTKEWFRRLQTMTCIDDVFYDFFSKVPILQARFDDRDNSHLYLRDDVDERLVKRWAPHTLKASTNVLSDYNKSVNWFNWIEKYCNRMHELSIDIEANHPQWPAWTFPKLNMLRLSCGYNNHFLNLKLLASIRCRHLNCLKFVGQHPISLINLQVVHNINLFDNLVTLQIFHFNESMENLLDQFNSNAHNSLRHLTLANRRVDFGRYKMNNKTMIAISKYANLSELKVILAGLDKTNTKYLFESCTKLTELYIESNFLSTKDCYSYHSCRLFSDIKSNCNSLKRLHLVWHDSMIDPEKVRGIKGTFPNVFVKLIQTNDRFTKTAEKIVSDIDEGLGRLFDEYQV